MRIAVTGATGFIGRYVLQSILDYDVEEVVAVTRDPTQLSGLDNRIRIVKMDIAYPKSNSFDLLGRPNTLIHLAWDGLPNYRSLHHFETELPRQFRFLKSLVEGGLSNLLITGTCFEYGIQSGALSEDLMTQPSNSYGYAKDALRRQLEFLKEVLPFNLTWARLFYNYGDGQPKNCLYSQLKGAVTRKERVFNMSGGEQLRDYLPVSEVARYLVQLAMQMRNYNGIVNVCSGRPISVRKVVEQWVKENNWDIELNLGYYPYPAYEPMAFWGNNTRLATFFKKD
jgi:nucleoside-diphosphate-sugar epimerase